MLVKLTISQLGLLDQLIILLIEDLTIQKRPTLTIEEASYGTLDQEIVQEHTSHIDE